ncbi:ADP-ribosylation factor-like protein 4D [Eriocheir sinensis]|uniref:ADP-ribosylation factor-like protein 4D n=1 Tax=Eriocheir sinensis TaxID=95602 RepID=UPI0021C9A398|nr:ADP-ribosylation factor-like protein 4D [Eriocheir sinensis]
MRRPARPVWLCAGWQVDTGSAHTAAPRLATHAAVGAGAGGLVGGVLGVGRVVAAGLAGLAGLVVGPPTLVLVGLDSSGKTTALLRLKYGHYVNTVPTVGFNCECLRGGGCSWVAWDVGGAKRVRPLWRAYTRGADAVLFVEDASSGEEWLEEARHELHVLVRRQAA